MKGPAVFVATFVTVIAGLSPPAHADPITFQILSSVEVRFGNEPPQIELSHQFNTPAGIIDARSLDGSNAGVIAIADVIGPNHARLSAQAFAYTSGSAPPSASANATAQLLDELRVFSDVEAEIVPTALTVIIHVNYEGSMRRERFGGGVARFVARYETVAPLGEPIVVQDEKRFRVPSPTPCDPNDGGGGGDPPSGGDGNTPSPPTGVAIASICEEPGAEEMEGELLLSFDFPLLTGIPAGLISTGALSLGMSVAAGAVSNGSSATVDFGSSMSVGTINFFAGGNPVSGIRVVGASGIEYPVNVGLTPPTQPVPEPATGLLLLAGIATAACRRWK